MLGGLLAAWDWRAVFWVNVPIGVLGTIWAYRSLHEIATTRRARIDWSGNITFAVGAGAAAGRHHLRHPAVRRAPDRAGRTRSCSAASRAGIVLLAAFCVVETQVADPMFQLSLFRIRAFAFGNIASLLGAIARGGLQFMLIIWLQGIWLPLHGYDYVETPLWAGIYLVPLTAGFLIAGPISGYLSDRYGPRLFATAGLLVTAAAFVGLLFLPVDFSYWEFALLIFCNGARVRPVRLAEHLRHHEQRPGQAPRRGIGDAGHLPELRHVAVDRHLLLADDRRAGVDPAAHPGQRAARAGRARVRCGAHGQPAAGEHAVRLVPRL